MAETNDKSKDSGKTSKVSDEKLKTIEGASTVMNIVDKVVDILSNTGKINKG